MGNYAGVDWASEKHDVLVQDEAGEELLAASFAHDEEGLRSLCRALVRMKVTLFAIERPDGLLVERLLDAGLRLLALHPNQVAAARPRFRAAGGKSDRFDAFVLCELARTDHHRFRVLEPDSDQTKALRAMTRAREDLVQSRVALTNQLRAELERFWPGPIGLFSDLDNLISLAFLKRYPSPTDACGLGEQRLQGFLTREHYSGHKPPAELLAKLRRAPEGRAGALECQARRAVVLSLVAALEPIVAAIRQLERRSASIPTARSSCRCSAPPEASSPRPQCWPRSATAAHATPPVTRSRVTPARPRSRSNPASARSPASAGHATNGCEEPSTRSPTAPATGTPSGPPTTTPARSLAATTTPRATRTLGRAWCRVVWSCWQNRTPYDPACHRGLQQHVLVTIPATSGPRPDLIATQRMLGTAVTQRADQRAEGNALDGKPTSANTLGG